jgi:regulator of nonsense transcripts 2
MKSQQAAEREEQQRIKNLVLNYDLREDDQNDGIPNAPPFEPIVQPPLGRNSNTKGPKPGLDHYNPSLSRAEKSGRHGPRARRLNLSDVDWYGTAASLADGPGGKSALQSPFRSPTKEHLNLSKKPG